MTLTELRRLAESLPPGASLTLPREALLELCGENGAAAAVEQESDLTAAQLAERLGRKPSTVRGWCERGDFPGAYKLNGRDWRIPPAAAEAFRAAQQSNGSRGRRKAPPLGDWRKAIAG